MSAHALPASWPETALAFTAAALFALGRFLWAVAVVLLVLVGGPEPWT